MHEHAHRTVAQLAIHYLEDHSKQQLEAWLGPRWQEEWVALAVSVEPSLARAENAHLLPFQVTLFTETDTEFIAAAHCPQNRCSVAALLESKRVLNEDRFSNRDKQRALSYLLHYGLQVHNPINAGFQTDRGGRDTYIKDSELQAVNLAWIWNIDLFERMNEHWFTLAQKLNREMSRQEAEQWLTESNPVEWAFESHLLARNVVYPLASGGRYNAQLSAQGQALLRRQMQKAAVRIAAVVNEVFAE